MINLDAYFARIGHDGPTAPTPATLAALHEAHVAAIPFENLDVLMGHEVRLDLASVEAKLVGSRRGGWCFEHNRLFQAVLESVGFRVTALAARVRMGATRVLPRMHRLMLVEIAGRPWVADVGFGGDGLVTPLPLAADAQTPVPGGLARLTPEPGGWALQARHGDESQPWTDLYGFTLEPQHEVDFEVGNFYLSHHPASRFRQTLTAQRTWRDRRLILRDRTVSRRDADGLTERTVAGDAELLALLADAFEIDVPPGLPLPD